MGHMGHDPLGCRLASQVACEPGQWVKWVMAIGISKRFWERGRERGRGRVMGHLGHMGTPFLVAPMFCARRHISTTVRIYSIFNHLDNIFKSITHITHCPMKRGARH
jgi:hypothetical protein